ncbi:MAG: nitroreductase family deazaflavin-dependent oxidoreductase [Chloroflexi bacterium]|nr:MAG: nitroreductase family deazaflavin-dependent oxidoreductase [Chloroflexota bacterium]
MKEFNLKLVEEFRANHGVLTGQMAGRQVMLLTTTGARTGLERTVVIGYRRADDLFVAIASNNGAPSDPKWLRNLLADPKATIEVGPEKLEVRARVAEGAERERLGAVVEYLDRQQKLTGREIPVVALEPVR